MSTYETRFVREVEVPELLNLWHLSRVPTSGIKESARWHRMRWTAAAFHKAHPEVSETGAYKDLDTILH